MRLARGLQPLPLGLQTGALAIEGLGQRVHHGLGPLGVALAQRGFHPAADVRHLAGPQLQGRALHAVGQRQEGPGVRSHPRPLH